MSPRSVKDFLTSKFGMFLVFIAVLFGGLFVYGRNQAEEKRALRLATTAKKAAEVGKVRVPLDEGLESGVPQQVSAGDSTSDGGGGRIVPFRPPPARAEPTVNRAPAPPPISTRVDEPKKKPRKLRYPTLLAAYVAPTPQRAEQAPPKRFVPYGTLLKCKLVNTVDSSNLETPVIAVLLEDVWQNGERVIPANTLVHGTARTGRIRDRVSANGTWRVVWQDGRELSFSGVALDREYEHDIDGYGITDGSAGIRGRVLATDDSQELKMLASAALSGFARGTQDRTQTAIGTTIVGSVSNGVREGVGDVFELYAQRTLREIEQNGYFVRVPAGKEFYVYVTETMNPEKAKVAGTRMDPAVSAVTPSATSDPAPQSGRENR